METKNSCENFIIDKKPSNICNFENCNKRSSFCNKDETLACFCGIHKTENMINIKTNFCSVLECNMCARFNFIGEKKVNTVLYIKKKE